MIAVLLALSLQWVESSIIGTHADNSKGPLAIFVSSESPDTLPSGLVPNQWNTVTLSSIPVDSKAVFLSGLLIITYPAVPIGICDLTATFRAPGSTLDPNNYQLQTLEAVYGSGVRSNAATWVPVINRQFEVFYRMTPGCPSLMNLSLQAYVR